MAIETTENTKLIAEQTNKTPILILEIDGVDTIYGNIDIKEIVKIGCPGLLIGGFVIGGQKSIEDQETLISLQQGTTTRISQTIRPDKGTGESISSMKIALVDKDLQISQLITPGEIVTDLLSRRAKVWLLFEGTNFKEDAVLLFRGQIDDIDSLNGGLVLLNIAHPDQKKRGEIFTKAETELDGAITSGATVATVDSTTDFLSPVLGPDSLNDSSLTFYVKINDEIMRYEATSVTQFQTLTRGQLGTVAAAHDDGDTVESFYRLEGNSMDLALKIMLSGVNDFYVEDLDITNFVRISGTETEPNSMFFKGQDLVRDHNIRVGDFVTTTLASNGANNVSAKVIDGITQLDTGTLVIITGVTFVEENDTAGVCAIRSQFDTLGEGLAMINEEVDIAKHLEIQRQFLASFDYDFFIDDTIVGREFISSEIYLPAGCFTVPRKAQASLGVHVGPLPTVNIKTIDTSNVEAPSKLKIRRTTTRNFYNTFIHRWERDALDPDKFFRSEIEFSTVSRAQIEDQGNTVLEIVASGMRDALSARNLAQQAQSRLSRKYKLAAEGIKGIKINLKAGFDIEVDDVILLDMPSLKITDIKTGGAKEAGVARLWAIENITRDLRKGKTTIDVIDPNFDKDARFSVISPASKIKTGVSTSSFIIKESFGSRFGANEFQKWQSLIGASILVRTSDFVTTGTALLSSVNGNTITLASALGFTPAADYIMELDEYDNQNANIKLVFCFLSDASNNFADGGIPYQLF